MGHSLLPPHSGGVSWSTCSQYFWNILMATFFLFLQLFFLTKVRASISKCFRTSHIGEWRIPRQPPSSSPQPRHSLSPVFIFYNSFFLNIKGRKSAEKSVIFQAWCHGVTYIAAVSWCEALHAPWRCLVCKSKMFSQYALSKQLHCNEWGAAKQESGGPGCFS